MYVCMYVCAEGGGGERNRANALVAAVNANRTAARLPALRNSKGLGCMALQYLAHCLTTATQDTTTCGTDELGSSCHPPERDVTEVYAANCGVELPTVDLISARLLGCSFTHDDNDGSVLVTGANASSTVRGKEHTQVGAGLLRPRRHGPDFWCLLFSAGKPGTTFRLEAAGRGIVQPQGCFSDPDDALTCSIGSGKLQLLASSMPLLLLPVLALGL